MDEVVTLTFENPHPTHCGGCYLRGEDGNQYGTWYEGEDYRTCMICGNPIEEVE